MSAPSDETWLAEAVALAQQNVADGGGPFGAVIVADGAVIARGQNRVTRDMDPTAHAEVTAIRIACRERGD
jgi:guanine deaminase